ncbi:AAA domain (dynein-related subfamily) [Butyrivibrio fibrisolvens DSM 3071]|uniref:AAA domain (Dynein-related subfamily) n=1 Tax=Butyrivibrio fibrisolvens DSM 3071 TaxID=1121131 RepID=A0A1M5YM49_BUTFI|nr:MoxR family ATPase [Butyrivibrio fibrisolvens]SHI12623.1 AAA domain (dynein-related subfamily) [Butyrivibrio fibrisolvens DSM 3071]
MNNWLVFLKEEGISSDIIKDVEDFNKEHETPQIYTSRIPDPKYLYYGKDIWEKALCSILAGENILLSGPKATGKNVLAQNLAAVFERPVWDVSFHINVDASWLVGTDTFDGEKVVFRQGPVLECAINGGFGVLDEINMARNEALAVLHSVLDFRRVLDVPGYERTSLNDATRFIATMNYGYAGTRDLNEALCSRFAVIDMPVINEEDLKRLIIREYPDIKTDICDQFVRLYKEIEKKAESAEITERALDIRGLLGAIGLMKKGIKSGPAISMCIVNKTFDSYERKLVSDVVDARIPADLDREVIFA